MTQKIKALIIDDEPGCIETLSLLLERYHPDVELCGTAMSADKGLDLIASHRKPGVDLVFLDIQMPEKDGFTLLQELPEVRFNIIFTTAYDDYAMRAIRFSALDFLLKPIDNNELRIALDRLRNLQTKAEMARLLEFRQQVLSRTVFEKLAVSTLNDILLIPLNDIIYLASDNNYTEVHLQKGEKIISSKNIGHYQDILSDSHFFRIHNSYMINMKRMKRYIRGGTGMVEMEGGTKLSVSTRRREEFVRQLSLI